MRLSRNTMLITGAALVLVVGAAAYLLVKDDSSDGDTVDTSAELAPEEGENAAEAFADGKDELLQVSGSLLQLRDLDSGEETDLDELPSAEVVAAPGSTWLAYVDRTAADEAELHLYDTETGDDTAVGPGLDPVWNSTGTRVAFFRTDDPACQDESCTGQVMVADPEGGEPAEVLPAGAWRLIGWSGNLILLLDDDQPTKTILASTSGETRELDFPASEVKGASPDGRWLIRSGGKNTLVVPMEGGGVAGHGVKVDIGDEFLTSAFFSPDSAQVAARAQPPVKEAVDLDALVAELKQKVRDGKLTKKEARAQYQEAAEGSAVKSHIVMFSPEEPEAERFDPSERPREILWSPENDAFVYSALVDPDQDLFQSFYCAADQSKACDLVTSWSRGVQLLRIQ